MWSISTATARTYLCRPVGILLALATLGIAAVTVIYNHRDRPLIRRLMLGLLPLAVIPVHFAWRKPRYGEWLPNTYYAKHVTTWPESGVRYLGSFIFEYALWTWVLVLLAWLWRLGPLFARREKLGLPCQRSFLTASVWLALLGHLTYYTFIIGGDHFEYRVYSHLIPLTFGVIPLATRSSIPQNAAEHRALPHLYHRFLGRPLDSLARNKGPEPTRNHACYDGARRDLWPASMRWYVQPFDQMQAWLIKYRVGMRHQEHKIFFLNQQHYIPDSETILRQFSVSAEALGPYPVIAYGSVGVLGWRMAHNRFPPPGYVECFTPNVEPRITLYYNESGVQVTSMHRYIKINPRAKPLTAQKIRECQTRTW
jgi:arabinofuranosyltransferase